jgi:hypothetical protein
MSNINLDINTYNIGELEKLLKLPKNYTSENIYYSKESIANSISKSNISESKKTELYIFLDNIKNKLIENLLATTNNNNNNSIYAIKQYNGNQYITNNGENTLGNYKQTNKSLLKKIYTIDSIFRQNYELIDNQSHNYIIQLPETISRAITMSISSIEIPLTYHNVSNYYNNNFFTIEQLSSAGTSLATTIIELSPGLYESRISSYAANDVRKIICYDIEREINDKIQNVNFIDISNNLKFVIEPRSGFSCFKYDNSNNITNNVLGTYKIRINFNVNNPNANSSNCYSNELYQKLGWQLGFRNNSIIIDSSDVYAVSTGICHINYPRYIYIALDDFQSSSQNHFAIASDSIVAPNIITRINILSLLEEKTAFKQGAYAGDIYYNHKHIREYFGPTSINKLKVQLLDEYGRPFSLNNMDWSFIITFECLYN